MSDVDTFCRACRCQVIGLSDNSLESYNIFEVDGLAMKLMECASIQIQPYDDYPPNVCEICFQKINDFHEFRQMCRLSMEHFKETLKTEMKVQTEIKTDTASEAAQTPHAGSIVIDGSADQVEVKYEYNLECLEDDPLLDGMEDSTLHEIEIERVMRIIRNDIKGPSRSNVIQKLKPVTITNQNIAGPPAIPVINNTCEVEMPDNDKQNDTSLSLSQDDNSENSMDGEEFFSDACTDTSVEEAKVVVNFNTRYQCKMCPRRFRLKHCYKSHRRTHQGLLEYACTFENCERQFRRHCDLRQHMRGHDGLPREYRCKRDKCGKVYYRDKELRQHLIHEHGVPPHFQCDFKDCGQKFQSKSYLKKHKHARHNVGQPQPSQTHVCDTCGALLKSLASLRNHALIHVHRSEWPYTCDVDGCNKKFRLVQALNVHKRRHAGIKNYPCPHCEMRFVTSTNLKYHVNVHTNELKYPCDFCPKVYRTPDTLRVHIEKKHGIINRYACSFCERTFTTGNAKMAHEMTHLGKAAKEETDTPQGSSAGVDKEGEKNARFTCSHCERVFASMLRKNQHELTHTEEKPYVCEQCGVRFRLSSYLRRHVSSHGEHRKYGGTSFKCTVCARTFKSEISRKHHEMKHTKEKPYRCDECGFYFRWPNNLSRHKKLHLRDKNTTVTQEECVTLEEELEILEEDEAEEGSTTLVVSA